MRRLIEQAVLLFLLTAFAVSCGPARKGAEEPREPAPEQVIEMEPVKVVATEKDDGFDMDVYDAGDLFDRGNELLDKKKCAAAVRIYDRLLKEFSSSSLVVPTLYNSALCLERLDRCDEAVKRYKSIYIDYADSPDAKDALFRAGGCREKTGQWMEAEIVFTMLLGRDDIDATEKLEAMARRGAALVGMGKYEEAEFQLREAIAYYRYGTGHEKIVTDYHAAMAQFYLGEIPRLKMYEIKLTENEVEFQRDLDRKARLLLKAQTHYVLAIRTMNPYWASAAGLRIGKIFASLYDDIIAVPAPAWIEKDPELLQIHMNARHRYIRQLILKAISVWEETVLMAERLGMNNEWVQEVNVQLERVREVLKEADGEAEEVPEMEKVDPVDLEDAGPTPDVAPVG